MPKKKGMESESTTIATAGRSAAVKGERGGDEATKRGKGMPAEAGHAPRRPSAAISRGGAISCQAEGLPLTP